MVERSNNNGKLSTAYDLVIIGGGYTGAWLSYYTAKECPHRQVLTVDSAAFGSGAARFSADLDFPNNPTKDHRYLSQTSRRLLQQALRDMPQLPLMPVKAVAVGSNPKALEQLEGQVLVSHTETLTVSGHAFLQNYQWQYSGITAQRATDKTMISRLMEKAKTYSRDIDFRTGVSVSDVKRCNGFYEVQLNGQSVKSRQVVTAIGPWAAAAPWVQRQGMLMPRVKKVVAFLLPLQPAPDDSLIYMMDEGAFLLPQPESGRWLFSITSSEWDCTPEAGKLGISADDHRLAAAMLEKYAPSLLPYLSEGLVFCDAYSPARCPVVHPLSADGSHLLAGAASGSGFRLSPAIAYETLQLLKNTCYHGQPA